MHPNNGSVTGVVPNVIDTIREELVAAARRTGVTRRQAESMANSVDEAVRRTHGGSERYIPVQDKSIRNRDIVSEYNGRNRDQLCRLHGISRSTIKRILAETCGCGANGQVGDRI